jgi:hypothetical protein
MGKVSILLCALLFSFAGTVLSFSQEVQVEKIWDEAPHNAFTDLVRWKGCFWCTFREAGSHVPKNASDNGKIRILKSADGSEWQSVALLSSEKYDLRDPKLSVAPGNKLMITIGGSNYNNGILIDMMPHVSFSGDGKIFTDPIPALVDEGIRSSYDWIWRVTWYKKSGYGIVYQSRLEGGRSRIRLLKTHDGISYHAVSDLNVDSLPNESTIRFDKEGRMIIMVRREGGAKGILGISRPPYTGWNWTNLEYRLGGPNFLLLKDGSLCIGTRLYGSDGSRTVINLTTPDGVIKKQIMLPSGGDTSYPGMLIFKKELWVSYYSGHEGRVSVYLARIKLKHLK